MNVDAEELLTANLALIERAIAFACRRHQLLPEDAEEFASIVKLRLVENDYAILRAHEGRSKLSTYLGVVVQRMALDYRIHEWGKWHDSAEAKRLGPLAVELERHLHRDGRTLGEALALLAPRHEGVTTESLAALAGRLPQRAPRMREVALDDASPVASPPAEDAEAHLLAGERREIADRVSALMNDSIESLPEEERLLLQLRFQEGMTVAQIARATHEDQKQLYRRIERCMRDIRRGLEETGISPGDVLDLIGRDDAVLQFQLGKASPRPPKDLS